MRYNKASLVYVFMLLGASLLCASANMQGFSRSESSNSNGGRSNNFNYRRVFSHGFRVHGNHATDEEQKRLTPNGANPLHNWWDVRVKFKDFDSIRVQNVVEKPYMLSRKSLSEVQEMWLKTSPADFNKWFRRPTFKHALPCNHHGVKSLHMFFELYELFVNCFKSLQLF